jgi:branched-chain amino acid transport system substrate-binding protein
MLCRLGNASTFTKASMAFSAKHHIRLYLSCIPLLCALNVQAEPGVTDGAIVIGMSAPIHGAYGSLGQDMLEVIRASFAEVNAAGGINGRKLELDSFDDDGETSRTIANTKTLINDHQVFALIGYCGDESISATLPLLSAAKIPLIGAVSGANGLRKPVNRNVFYLRASYSDEIAAMVAQISSLQLSRIAVFYQNDALGKANADMFDALLKKNKMPPATMTSVEPHESYIGDANVSVAVQLLGKSNPQAVLMLTPYKPAAELVLQMKKAGLYPQFLAVSTVGTEQLTQLLGVNGRGIGISQVMPYPWDSSIPVVRSYQNLMTAEDKTAAFSYSGLEGYMMSRVMIEGLKRAGKNLTREKLIEVMDGLNLNLGGYHVAYSPDNHDGSKFVELTVTSIGGRPAR